MWLKVCGIQMEENGRWLAGRGIDAIGLNRYPDSSRFVSEEQAYRISDEAHRKRSSVACVGVYVNESTDTIREEINEFDLDAVQLHGDESPRQVAELSGDTRVIKAFSVDPNFDVGTLDRYDPWAYLLDGHAPGRYGGTGNAAPWKRIRPWTEEYRIILAGGLTPDNLLGAAHMARPWGLDVNSGVEGDDGTKDLVKLKALLERYQSLEQDETREETSE